ncbi:hypothetical protein NDU88_003305 [Pleurodeles waltl]|uniref:Uncharacterized protein n=1 Tax=Pleurodeles waltl TaxID=8319 RepID=A0AAV7VF34_PLEWA|nr:hypothetical protein NDU88_003305 [Pleurodeles waltl]
MWRQLLPQLRCPEHHPILYGCVAIPRLLASPGVKKSTPCLARLSHLECLIRGYLFSLFARVFRWQTDERSKAGSRARLTSRKVASSGEVFSSSYPDRRMDQKIKEKTKG